MIERSEYSVARFKMSYRNSYICATSDDPTGSSKKMASEGDRSGVEAEVEKLKEALTAERAKNADTKREL